MGSSNRSDLRCGGNKDWEGKLRRAAALILEVQLSLSEWMRDEDQYDNAADDGALRTRLILARTLIEDEIPPDEAQK